MDSFDVVSIPSNNMFIAVDQETVTSSKRDRFLQTYLPQQNFDLPDSMMYYTTMNPATPKGYQKMIQTCKYFFIKNSIIIRANSVYNGKKWSNYLHGAWEGHVYDLSKFASKFWIIDRFSLYSTKTGNQNLLSVFISKLFRYDVKDLAISNQILSYNDFVFLASNVYYIHLRGVIVKHNDDSILSLENLLHTAANCKQFCVSPALTNITSKTIKELIKIPHFWRLKYFWLTDVSDKFELDDFYAYMKKNKCTIVNISFHDSISAAYKERLEAIIDEILQTKIFDYKSPLITFSGFDFERSSKLGSIFRSHCDLFY